ncbi:DUF2501 domain-containing protein [Variovorax sp. NFACC27]|uniref:DUF2501 domain-containing protein n=1 Tax=Variovorax gossypii TaxID=1679495 RepID=A0A3S0J2V2_9BURK|nr:MULTISPECIES: DUF2501 domain-containing protein [Variovorax]SEF28666.1 Protein of unknown function [Variovorax sp. NFACC28]SEG79022.1 Protein of unknown function [Variovorax sp. NFACC29]SFC93825.1 Protein of unknown function [Variovorax sp. NFACC26]SFG07429.1 Protein of unknown function [Variovorax sp. NFACC27]RTQ31804.1 DUF2501 domain-containing protein [Variovorax gossypii]
MHARSTLIALALLAAGASAQANNLLDQLKEKAGEAATANSQGGAGSSTGGSALGNLGSSLGFKMPAIGTSTMGNAAGVLQYCVKNNYLGGDAASVKDKLLAKITGQKKQETGFASGAKGLLQGGDGKSLNFKGLSSKVKEKACDYVLKNATSLI